MSIFGKKIEPSILEANADDLYNRGQWQEARQAYTNLYQTFYNLHKAVDCKRITIKQILCDEKLGLWDKAARKYEEQGNYLDAGRCYENNSVTLDEAIRCYKKASTPINVARCCFLNGWYFDSYCEYSNINDFEHAYEAAKLFIEEFENSKVSDSTLKRTGIIIQDCIMNNHLNEAIQLFTQALHFKNPYSQTKVIVNSYEMSTRNNSYYQLVFNDMWDLEGFILEKIYEKPLELANAIKQYPSRRIPNGLFAILDGHLNSESSILYSGLIKLRQDETVDTSFKNKIISLADVWLDKAKEESGDKYSKGVKINEFVHVAGDITEAGATVVKGSAYVMGQLGGEDSSIKCPTCGTQLKKEAKFCNQCGGTIITSGGNTKCRICGSALLPGSKFCDSCGNKINT